jgi:hypothetical protein
MFWFSISIFVALFLVGIARVLLAFGQHQSRTSGNTIGKEKPVSIGVANSMLAVVGLICLLTRFASPTDAVLGILVMIVFVEVIFRVLPPSAPS